jgi:hypothetical protein
MSRPDPSDLLTPQTSPQGYAQAFYQFVIGALLAIHTGNFLHPAKPPFSVAFDHCSVFVAHFKTSRLMLGSGKNSINYAHQKRIQSGIGRDDVE